METKMNQKERVERLEDNVHELQCELMLLKTSTKNIDLELLHIESELSTLKKSKSFPIFKLIFLLTTLILIGKIWIF